MSLIRFAARSMFAGHFISSGLSAVRNPDETAASAESFTDKAVPLVQRVVPAQYSSSVPEQAATWVRIGGLLKIVGGAMFATGIGRRLGAMFLVPGALLDVAVAWPGKDASTQEKREARQHALTNVALLGGAILATRDLHGQPSLAWRAEHKRQLAAKQAGVVADKAQAMSARARKKARKQVKAAKKQARKMAKQVQR